MFSQHVNRAHDPAALLDIGPGEVLANLAASTAPRVATGTLDALELELELDCAADEASSGTAVPRATPAVTA